MIIKKITLAIIGILSLLIALIALLIPIFPSSPFFIFGLAMIAPDKTENLASRVKNFFKKNFTKDSEVK